MFALLTGASKRQFVMWTMPESHESLPMRAAHGSMPNTHWRMKPHGPEDAGVTILNARTDRSRLIEESAARFWNRYLELHPLAATEFGVGDYDDRLDDVSPQGFERRASFFSDTLAESDRLRDAVASQDDGLAVDFIVAIARNQLRRIEVGAQFITAIDHIAGIQTRLSDAAALQPTETPDDVDRLLRRIREFPAHVEGLLRLLDEGTRRGLTAPRTVTLRLVEQLDRLLSFAPEASPIVAELRHPDRDGARVAESVGAWVLPTLSGLREYLVRQYLRATRTRPGLGSAPGGDAIYLAEAGAWTGAPVDPDDLHRIGLEMLAAIDAERRQIASGQGYRSVEAARDDLVAGPRSAPHSRDELLSRVREDVERAATSSRGVFSRWPDRPIEVRLVEPYRESDAGMAFYLPASSDGTRAALYYVNAYDLPTRTFPRLAACTFHEAIPGHHLQHALEAQLEGLPAVRTMGARLAGESLLEGWGVYAERLADDLGLYRDPAERLGMLDGQALRAARLVVDTGIHARGWTRRHAIDVIERAGTPTNAVNEADRYTVWPGQALTYMVGFQAIENLRRKWETLGPGFSRAAFHDALLLRGALPLAEVERYAGPPSPGRGQ